MTGRTPPAKRALRREIVGLLCLKAVGLTVLYLAFFGPATRAHIAAPELVTHLTGTPSH